ncbi:MAG: DUF1062 domain-containing protein [Pseudomonadota bacterium]
MDGILRVQWTLKPGAAPGILRRCPRCDQSRRFETTDRFRVNAQKKRIDAWLIYRCSTCGATWNRPVFRRREVTSVAPADLRDMQENCVEAARRIAQDGMTGMPLKETASDGNCLTVSKRLQAPRPGIVRSIGLTIHMAEPVSTRLDRVLAQELRLSRSRVRDWARRGTLCMKPASALRKAPVDGQALLIDLTHLSAEDAGPSVSQIVQAVLPESAETPGRC